MVQHGGTYEALLKRTAILVLHNFHRILTSTEVLLAPTAQVPIELEKLFVVIEHALPDREQLEGIDGGRRMGNHAANGGPLKTPGTP
jgi:hypothetical protein